MKVLIVSLLKRKISPQITAARPRMIYDLSRKLISKGHQVTILGTGDSRVPGAKVLPVIPKGFIELPSFENPFYAHTAFLVKMAKMVEKSASKFDVVHNHCYPEFINLLIQSNLKTPMLTTIHGQMTPEMDETLSYFASHNLVAISKAARQLAKKTKISRVIYNGVDTKLYSFNQKKGDYLLWIGRLSKAKDKRGHYIDPKGVKWAIKLARESGEKLLISGNVEDKRFFEKEVKPYLSKKIKWIGPISKEQPLSKQEVSKLMQKAKAFLMTVNWHEPFGLVMAESMSCGTPVIGFDRGAVSELVDDGKTGFVVKPQAGLAGLKKALLKVDTISPTDCRKHVLAKFSLEAMADNYESFYFDLSKKSPDSSF